MTQSLLSRLMSLVVYLCPGSLWRNYANSLGRRSDVNCGCPFFGFVDAYWVYLVECAPIHTAQNVKEFAKIQFWSSNKGKRKEENIDRPREYQTDLVPRVSAAGQFKMLYHVIIVKYPQSFSLWQHPITTRCEPSSISGALSFCMEKPGRIFCLKKQNKFSE